MDALYLTELGGQVTVLQLGANIVAAMPMKRPINGHSSAYSADGATGSLLRQPSNALLTSYPAPSTAHAPGTSHRRPRVLTAPPRRPSGEVDLAPGLTVWVPSSGSAGTPSLLRQMTGWLAFGRVVRSITAPIGCATRDRADSLATRTLNQHKPASEPAGQIPTSRRLLQGEVTQRL